MSLRLPARFSHTLGVGILICFGFLAAGAANATGLSVYVLAPGPTVPLTAVETAGSSKPVFAQDFTIPYDKIQAAILTAIATELAKLQPQLAGVAKCPTVICPNAVSPIRRFNYYARTTEICKLFHARISALLKIGNL